MGQWDVDTKKKAGIIMIRLEGALTADEMRAFLKAHNRAIDGFNGGDYRVFVDIRQMHTLNPECAALLQEAKEYSSSHKNFRGSAVWATSAMVAMQHRRTSVEGGVMDTELISDDEAALWDHLKKVHRQ
jgi:hypothetical protein